MSAQKLSHDANEVVRKIVRVIESNHHIELEMEEIITLIAIVQGGIINYHGKE